MENYLSCLNHRCNNENVIKKHCNDALSTHSRTENMCQLNACTNAIMNNFSSVAEAYSEPYQTSNMERFAETINSF